MVCSYKKTCSCRLAIIKQSEECVFVNSALKIPCHVVKNTLLQTAFSAILPTGRLAKLKNQYMRQCDLIKTYILIFNEIIRKNLEYKK